jgi:hypothetical protein
MKDQPIRCPFCLKPFAEQRDLREHMKRKRHSIDGAKGFVRNTPEHRMAEYHRDKTGQDVKLYR